MSGTWTDLFVLFYSVATGFVAAGIVSSYYQMITTKPAHFGIFGTTASQLVLTAFFCALTGPFILVRNAFASGFRDRETMPWVLGSLAVSVMWSSCSGLIVLYLTIIARHGLT